MTTASNIVGLALRSAGITGVGQTPLAQDQSDATVILAEMIEGWQRERAILGIAETLPFFPDFTTDVPFWTQYEPALMWGLTVRLEAAYGLQPDEAKTKLAENYSQALQANNKQFQPASGYAVDDSTIAGIVFLALRAAGRVTDQQSVVFGSQDMTDGLSLLSEMIDEWQLERTVTVTPGTFPAIPLVGQIASQVAFPVGYKSAVVLNLAVRIKVSFGEEPSKILVERADRALAVVQANNKQVQPAANPGAVTSALQLIYLALRMCGRINDQQSVAPGSQDVNDAFASLCMMLGQWQRKRWLIPNLTELVCISTGAQSYGIGPTSAGRIGFTDQFTDQLEKNVALAPFGANRPDRIESAFARLITGGLEVDYPLEVIGSREDYNAIGVKDLVSFPSQVYYDSGYPLGTLYFWPIPQQNQFELHVFVKTQLQQFVAVTDPLNAPPEYVEAMLYNLAARLCSVFRIPVGPDIANMARATLNTIRNANIQVPELGMPDGMPSNRLWGGGGGSWLGGIAFAQTGTAS